VSSDAQESTLHQENLLLRRQVGPSVLGIVIAIGRRASDSLTARKEACIIVWCHHHCRGLKQTSEKITNILRFSHPRKALLFAFKRSHLTLQSLQSVQRADPAKVKNEHSLCVFIGRYWCWQNDFRRLKHRFRELGHPVFMTVPTSNWSELYTLKARGLD